MSSKTIKELQVKLTMNMKPFENSMKKGARIVSDFGKKVGQSMSNVGKQMSLAISAPLAAIGAVALKAFDTQIQAENKLRVALKANGEAVNEVFDDYKKFATELQRVSTVGDETTLELLQVAQSMGVTGEGAKIATKQAIGLAKAMGVSERSTIRMTSALADGDANMLKRYLPSLKKIKDETKMVAEANRLLGNMFGIVKEEANSGLGPLKQLSNQFGDLLEDFGAIVAEGLKPFIEKIKNLITWLQSLDDRIKLVMVAVGLFAGSAGPALIAIGFMTTALATLVPVIVSVSTAIASSILSIAPWVVLIGAGYVAVKNLGKVIGLLAQIMSISLTSAIDEIVIPIFKKLIDLVALVGKEWTRLITLIKTRSFSKASEEAEKFADGMKSVFETIKKEGAESIKSSTEKITKAISEWGAGVEDSSDGLDSAMKDIGKTLLNTAGGVGKDLGIKIGEEMALAIKAMVPEIKMPKVAGVATNSSATNVGGSGGGGSGGGGETSGGGDIVSSMRDKYNSIKSLLGETLAELNKKWSDYNAEMVLKNQEAINSKTEAWFGFSATFGGIIETMQSVTATTFQMMTDGFANAVAEAVIYGKSLVDSLKSLALQIGKAVISMLIKIGIQKVAQTLISTSAEKVGSLATIKTMGARAFAGGVASMASAPFPLNLTAPLFGAAMEALALSSMSRMARGGIVNGATPAIIGEAGPEAVIPLDRMDEMTGTKEQTIVIELDGETLTRTVLKNMPREARLSTGVTM